MKKFEYSGVIGFKEGFQNQLTNEERIEKACKLMDSKGLTQGEQFSVIGAFMDFFKYDYPFITEKKGKFYSEHEPIKSFQFNSENEVILANAIYESTKDNFNPNDFIQMLKYVMRVINLESPWSK